MEIFTTGVILLVVFMAVLYISILYAFTPMKCPKCGEQMECYYNEEKQEFEYECPKCGNTIKYDEENQAN